MVLRDQMTKVDIKPRFLTKAICAVNSTSVTHKGPHDTLPYNKQTARHSTFK